MQLPVTNELTFPEFVFAQVKTDLNPKAVMRKPWRNFKFTDLN